MSASAAFIRAIREAPDDDAPRLIFADWLEERGEGERAEFIRLQCRIDWLLRSVQNWAQTPSNVPGGTMEDGGIAGERLAEAQALQRREAEVLHDHEWDWTHAVCPELHRGSYSEGNHYWLYARKWNRGFLYSFSIEATDCLTYLDAILAEHPVREVRLTTYPYLQENKIPGRTRDELELELLQRRWPGITFHLPEAQRARWIQQQTVRFTIADLPAHMRIERADVSTEPDCHLYWGHGRDFVVATAATDHIGPVLVTCTSHLSDGSVISERTQIVFHPDEAHGELVDLRRYDQTDFVINGNPAVAPPLGVIDASDDGPPDAPAERRESAAQRARQLEFAGRHGRQRRRRRH